MGKVLEEIGPSETEFIAKQKVFFVGTAPLSGDHHVNVSPKASGSSLKVLSPHKVAYLDLTGSGSETAAHVLENQRMVLMFCNLEEGPPKILRLHGKAEMIIKEEAKDDLKKLFSDDLTSDYGFRCIFVLNVERISSSCGYSLPIMHFDKQRRILAEYTERKGMEGMKDYCLEKNSFSIDGLSSIAHLRFPTKIIVTNPQDGYIHGEVVSPGDPRASKANHKKALQSLRPKASIVSQNSILIFIVGALFGYLVNLGFANSVGTALTHGTDL